MFLGVRNGFGLSGSSLLPIDDAAYLPVVGTPPYMASDFPTLENEMIPIRI